MAQCGAVCSVEELREQNIIAKDQRFSALNKKIPQNEPQEATNCLDF